jgi:hypothetical protein
MRSCGAVSRSRHERHQVKGRWSDPAASCFGIMGYAAGRPTVLHCIGRDFSAFFRDKMRIDARFAV